jgi:hypothetical protein
MGVTLATLYLVLVGGQITQFQFSPVTCHILAAHYKNGGHWQVYDADAKREKWLQIEQAVCVEPVEVTRLQLEPQN